MSCNLNLPNLIATWRRLLNLALLIGLVFNLGSLSLAHRTDFNLTCGDAIGLIQAINQANVSSEPDTITLNADHQASCIYTLTSPHNTTDGHNGLPSITSQITIEGEGATLERSNTGETPQFRIFHVAPSGQLTLNQVTVSGGRATSISLPANAGGGIANFGTVSLINSLVSGNTATYGGGLYNDFSGTLGLTHSAVSYNSEATMGGGLFNQGTLSLDSSIVNGNSAGLSGGGIANYGTLSLTDSTVSHNGQPSLGGGGIFNRGTLSLAHSTISGNNARGDGGGIFNDFGQTIYLTDSTISDNRTNRNGGGIFNFEKGTLSLTSSTVSENRARGDGGGIYNHYQGALSLIHSTISDNTSGNGGGIFNRSATALSLNHSTVSANNANFRGGGIANFGTLGLIKSTVRGNRAGQNGGGIFNNFQVLSLADSTVSGNSAGQKGGGLFNRGEMFLTNTIVATNPDGGDCANLGTLYSVNNPTGNGSCSPAWSEIKSNGEDASSSPLMEH